MNIYLDIDGVLLDGDDPAKNASQFISYVVSRYPTYWLTTHCKGDATPAIEYLRQVFDAETMDLITKIQPTNWDVAKTEAIDLKQPFLWFDDNLFSYERRALEEQGVLDNCIIVDLKKDPNQLQRFIESFPVPTTAL